MASLISKLQSNPQHNPEDWAENQAHRIAQAYAAAGRDDLEVLFYSGNIEERERPVVAVVYSGGEMDLLTSNAQVDLHLGVARHNKEIREHFASKGLA